MNDRGTQAYVGLPALGDRVQFVHDVIAAVAVIEKACDVERSSAGQTVVEEVSL